MIRLLTLIFFLSACSPVLPLENPFELPTISEVEASPLQIIVLDVGQGDATLVISPTGETLLIDTGPPEIGFYAIQSSLDEFNIDTLDWILLTHYDIDHIGNIPQILENYFPINGLIDRGDNTEQDHAIFQDYLHRAGDERITATAGRVLNLGGGATAKIIVANGNLIDGRRIHLNPHEENDASIGVLIEFEGFKYFTAGDLTGGGSPGGQETKDLESWTGEAVGDIHILHAGHHGSSSSSNSYFLESTQPEEVIISVGRENRYGHPTPEVLENINAVGAIAHRTDLSGDIRIVSKGGEYTVLP